MEKPAMDESAFGEALEIVRSWDFSLTVAKLQEPDYAGWTKGRGENAERDYKRYLALTRALGGFQPVPNGDIDRFWHEHILDTRRYEKDCASLFGKMLHHYPYFGMRGDTDKSNWINAAEISNEIWLHLFGEPLYAKQIETKSPRIGPSQGRKLMTTINITINIKDGEATFDVSKPQGASATENAAESQSEKFNPSLGDPTLMGGAMKCPQACPNEG